MSNTGRTSTYIRKTSVKESIQTNTGFKKTRFLHQAALNDTLIQLTSLVTPSGTTNYSAPNVSELTQTNLLQWASNFTLTSSIRGLLMQNIAYVITGASTIKLLFSAAENEIFEGVIDHNARTGLTMVDAAPLVSTGTLLAGQTDYNVGTPFKVGEYSAMRHGAVTVWVDGQLMYRNTGNAAPGAGVEGDYYEVHAGGGLGTIIRFNSADLVNDRLVSVMSVGSLVEKPNGSMMAVMESLQGQIDAMVPTLAELADVPETNFQGTPNNVDLKAFGDRVLTAEQDIDSLDTRVTSLENDIPPRIRVALTSVQSVAGSTFTKLQFNSVDGAYSNNTGWYNTSLYRYTPQRAGTYTVNAGAFGSAFTNRAEIFIVKNGTVFVTGHSGGTSADMGFDVSFEVPMNGTTDYIEIFTQHFGGGSINYTNSSNDTYFMAKWSGNL